MKKQVSFKKELMFKTRVSEISSISLEHNILKKDDGIISGEFIISGEYKMTEGSINREKYNFNLPFDIALNSKYDIDSAKIDIDNFYYDIVSNESLSVDIELVIEAEEVHNDMEVNGNINNNVNLVTNERGDIIKDNNINIDTNVNTNMNTFDDKLSNEIDKSNDKEDNTNIKTKREINIDNTNINTNNNTDTNTNTNLDKVNTNMFTNMDEETYKAYYVYIVREDDTIDKILAKYNITKEDFELYNNITDIKVNDKVIIPYDDI